MIESIKLICDNCKKISSISIGNFLGKLHFPLDEPVVKITRIWNCGYCNSDNKEEIQGKISLK